VAGAVAGAVEGVSAGSAGVSVAGSMRSMLPNKKQSGKHGGGGATGEIKIPCVQREDVLRCAPTLLGCAKP
jgi:hypothetical protein